MATNAIVPISPDEYRMMSSMADALVSSGFLPQSVNTPQKAVAIILVGRELGIAPWQALSTINVIQGKPTISPQLMLGLINRSGQLEDMKVTDDGTTCTVIMKRSGRTPHTFTFSMADANAMGLSSKDNWKKQPAVMRQWRAVGGCARIVFPDIILGLYTPEEMGADVRVSDDGAMEIVSVPTAPQTPVLVASNWSQNAAQAADFYHWTEGYVNERKEVGQALANAADGYEVKKLGDWRGTIPEAQAAVIAFVCAYDKARIEAMTTRMVDEPEDRRVTWYDLAISLIDRKPELAKEAV